MSKCDEDKRALLMRAGYDYRPDVNVWVNTLDRMLDGEVVAQLSLEQLREWITAGETRRT